MTELAFLAGPYAVTLIADEHNGQADAVAGWLALGWTFSSIYLMANYIFYLEKAGLLSLVAISTGLLNMFFLIERIRQLGAPEPVRAFPIAMVLRFLLNWLVAHKHHIMPWFQNPKFSVENCRS